MSPAMASSGGSKGGDVHIHINAQYVDPYAIERLTQEINREMGRQLGGKY